jgi:hypothetical protein
MDREMSRRAALPEGLALMLLARDAIAAIWQLNEDAAVAHRTGHPLAAASIVIFTPLPLTTCPRPNLSRFPRLTRGGWRPSI